MNRDRAILGEKPARHRRSGLANATDQDAGFFAHGFNFDLAVIQTFGLNSENGSRATAIYARIDEFDFAARSNSPP